LDHHFVDQNNLSDTIASSYRVLLLLNDDPEQIRICELVDQLFILAGDNPPKKGGFHMKLLDMNFSLIQESY